MTDPRTRELALGLHDLSWRLSRFGPHLAGLEPLPASELAVLRAVVDQPGLSVSEVAAAVAMRSSNVSAAVRALIDRGLVSKSPHDDDRRISVLHPTPQARTDKHAIDDALSGGVAELLAELPAESVSALLSAAPAIHLLAAALSAAAGSARTPVARIERDRES
ncbi:MAG: MarR family transcriptional regulator [Mycolicibacterium cosmeticum]|nr:MarR family transcriptional regulator [Mycolicibacterium cosmeticum]